MKWPQAFAAASFWTAVAFMVFCMARCQTELGKAHELNCSKPGTTCVN